MNRFLFIFIAIFGFWQPIQAAGGIDALRQMLLQRTNEPKMYIPESCYLGDDIRVLVHAPGASKVEFYASNEPGQVEIQGLATRLGSDYRKVGEQIMTKDQIRVEYSIPLDLEKDAALADKFYMFEALVSYDDPLTGQPVLRTANYYGSNANYSNNNAVKVKPPPERKMDPAAVARSMIPGFMPKQSQGGF